VAGGGALVSGAAATVSAENALYYSADWTKQHISSRGAFGVFYRVYRPEHADLLPLRTFSSAWNEQRSRGNSTYERAANGMKTAEHGRQPRTLNTQTALRAGRWAR